MSTPRSLEIPDGVDNGRLVTSRGEFATLEASPPGWEPADADSAVLLLPGWTGSKEDFLALLLPLAAAGRRVVAVDQRGQYETPGPDDASAYTLAELGLDVVALARSLNAGSVHLVGHSFGGLVARAAVLADPKVFTSATLLCSGPAGMPGPQADLLRLMVEAIPSQGLAAVYAAKRELERMNGLADPPAEIEAFLERRFCANHPVSLTEITRQLVDAPDQVDELAAVGVSTLVAYGANDDGWAIDQQRTMAERLGAPRAVISEAGHSPAVDQPEATARLLEEFWTAVVSGQAQPVGNNAP
ncbi:alpha/beta fold hydrolase [Actinopolymorpha alba]|uniref:alpha/beta fold hydrolase n=1 Tax=Actinopolymorpha alba TaxID=533267 RepID=UPI00037E97A5|nr:alpha/beta hydrolase [Actinopolymorpha alba]